MIDERERDFREAVRAAIRSHDEVRPWTCLRDDISYGIRTQERCPVCVARQEVLDELAWRRVADDYGVQAPPAGEGV